MASLSTLLAAMAIAAKKSKVREAFLKRIRDSDAQKDITAAEKKASAEAMAKIQAAADKTLGAGAPQRTQGELFEDTKLHHTDILEGQKQVQSPGKLETIPTSITETGSPALGATLKEQVTPSKLRQYFINQETGEVEYLGKGRPQMDPGSDLPNIPFKESEAYVPARFALEGSKRKRRPGDPRQKDFIGPRTEEQARDLVQDVKGLEQTMKELRPQVAKGNIPESELEEAAEAVMKFRAAKRAAKLKEKRRPKTKKKRAARLAALKRGEQKYMPRGTKPSDDPGPTEIFGEDTPLTAEQFRTQRIATDPDIASSLPSGSAEKRAAFRRKEQEDVKTMGRLVPAERGIITSQKQDIADLDKWLGSIKPTTALEDIGVPRQPKQPVLRLGDEPKGTARGFTSSKEPTPDVRKIPEGETGLVEPEVPINFDKDVNFGGGRILKRMTLAERKAFEARADKIKDDIRFIRQSKAKEGADIKAEEAIRYKKRLAQEREALEAFQEGADEGARGRPSLVHKHRRYTGEEFSTDNPAAADQLSDLGIVGRKGFVEDIQDVLDRHAITDIFKFDVLDEKGRVVFNRIISDMIGDKEFSKKISEIFTEMRAIEKALKRDVPTGKIYDAQRQQLQVARRDIAAIIQKLANGARVFRDAKNPASKEAGRAEIIEAVKRFRIPDVKVGKQTPGIPSAIKRDPTRFNFEDFIGPRTKGQDPRGIPVTRREKSIPKQAKDFIGPPMSAEMRRGDIKLFDSGASEFERLARERLK